MGKAVTNVDLIRDVPKVKGLECPPSVPAEPVSGSTVEGKDNLHRDNAGSWAFVDNNISTHLIRNAFGGADTMHLRQLLSIPAPHSRSYRDDIDVIIVGKPFSIKVGACTLGSIIYISLNSPVFCA